MADPRPNILLIYSDQHRYDCVGVNGHTLLQTPNMDRIANEGANFEHAYTPIPICVPARCSLLTGLFPTQHGTINNFDSESFRRLDPELPMSPRLVQQAGYYTTHIGRWHVDPEREPPAFGFHDYVPSWRYGKWRNRLAIPPCPTDAGMLGQTDPHVTPEESFLGWSADQVLRAVARSREGGDPFFIRWHMAEPHLPCRPCEPFASMYDPKTIEPWPGFGEESGKPYASRMLPQIWDHAGMTWEDWAPVVARYLGVISQLDSQIGRVLNTLERMGLLDDTLVIYSADHGDMCGSHGMIDKHNIMYDDVVRVPLMMRWPGRIAAGTRVDSFVSNAVDLAATFVDAAGAEVPASFAGRSILPLLSGAPGRDDIYASYHGNQFGGYSQRMIRDRRWKYIWNATAEDELYDLESDPGERVNRIADAACGDELKRLRGRLIHRMEELGDKLLNPWTRDALEHGRIL